MPAEWVLGTIGISFCVAIGIPPVGMIKPEGLAGSDARTLMKHGFHESAAKVMNDAKAKQGEKAEKKSK